MDPIEKVVIGKDIGDDLIGRIKERFPWLDIVTCSDEAEQDACISDADVLLTRIVPKDPTSAPRLKWVHFIWEGVDSMSRKFVESDVILTNSSGAHTDHIAEHVFSYLLALSRKSTMYGKYQERGEWLLWHDQPELRKLHGSKIGVVGYGRIGRAVAKIANGFSMDVLALKRNPKKIQQDKNQTGARYDVKGGIPKEFYGPDDLCKMLGMCDHVVLSIPLTDETRDMFGEKEFMAMKRSAFFINVGRGELVDEEALISALDEKWIGGAGLDVFR
ncbi:MAG: D-2-hydroxyacid dehydrogenase, partial [Candidatus Thermoplasmatota archaeon]|nr:D-2-hydroxyacid dehydrogenase [Candidatus Thermoplasmatota archaeon]